MNPNRKDTMTEYVDDPNLSTRANAKWREITESDRPLTFSDLAGLMEPNPDLPDCQSWSDDVKCQRPNHHAGHHEAVLTWPGRADVRSSSPAQDCPGCHGSGTEPSGTTHAGLAEHLACGECGPGCPQDCGCRVDDGPERAESGRGTAATLEAENARLTEALYLTRITLEATFRVLQEASGLPDDIDDPDCRDEMVLALRPRAEKAEAENARLVDRIERLSAEYEADLPESMAGDERLRRVFDDHANDVLGLLSDEDEGGE